VPIRVVPALGIGARRIGRQRVRDASRVLTQPDVTRVATNDARHLFSGLAPIGAAICDMDNVRKESRCSRRSSFQESLCATAPSISMCKTLQTRRVPIQQIVSYFREYESLAQLREVLNQCSFMLPLKLRMRTSGEEQCRHERPRVSPSGTIARFHNID